MSRNLSCLISTLSLFSCSHSAGYSDTQHFLSHFKTSKSQRMVHNFASLVLSESSKSKSFHHWCHSERNFRADKLFCSQLTLRNKHISETGNQERCSVNANVSCTHSLLKIPLRLIFPWANGFPSLLDTTHTRTRSFTCSCCRKCNPGIILAVIWKQAFWSSDFAVMAAAILIFNRKTVSVCNNRYIYFIPNQQGP